MLSLGQASPPAADQAQREFNCSDPSLWDNPQALGKNFDYRNCNTMWGLKSANDANVLMERYLLTLEKKLIDAKKNSDTGVLDQFKRQGLCDQSASMDQCHDSVRRRVMSHTLKVRDNILESNRLMTELDEGQAPQAAGVNPPQKSILDSIDEDRKAKTTGKSRSCEENPFIPCIVQYGKSGSIADPSRSKLDTATDALVKGQFEVSAVRQGTLRDRSGQKSIEISDPDRENEGLRKLVDRRLGDSSNSNIYERADYAKDLVDEKKRVDANAKDEKAKGTFLRDTTDVNWDAFNAVMDELSKRRAQAQTDGELVNFYLRVEDNSVGADGKRRQTLDSQLIQRLTE